MAQIDCAFWRPNPPCFELHVCLSQRTVQVDAVDNETIRFVQDARRLDGSYLKGRDAKACGDEPYRLLEIWTS